MGTYTTSAFVQEFLPPSSVGNNDGQVTTTQVTTAIGRASDDVDTGLPNYWGFPDQGDTPATPKTIQRIAAMLAGAELRLLLNMTNKLEENSIGERIKADAEEELRKLREGEKQIPPVTIADEAIDWEENDPIETGLHDFAFGGATGATTEVWEVIPESVRVTDNVNDPAQGYEYGTDFGVGYYPRHRRWCLVRYNSAITEGEGNDTVTYTFSYLKKRELREAEMRTFRVRRA